MITNGEVQEMVMKEGKAQTVRNILGLSKKRQLIPPSEGAVYNKLACIQNEINKLKINKNRQDGKIEFEQKTFIIPVACSGNTLPKKSTCGSVFMNEAFKLTTKKLVEENMALDEKNESISKEMNTIKGQLAK